MTMTGSDYLRIIDHTDKTITKYKMSTGFNSHKSIINPITSNTNQTPITSIGDTIYPFKASNELVIMGVNSWVLFMRKSDLGAVKWMTSNEDTGHEFPVRSICTDPDQKVIALV